MQPILDVRNLNKTYAGGFEALKDVSLDSLQERWWWPRPGSSRPILPSNFEGFWNRWVHGVSIQVASQFHLGGFLEMSENGIPQVNVVLE